MQRSLHETGTGHGRRPVEATRSWVEQSLFLATLVVGATVGSDHPVHEAEGAIGLVGAAITSQSGYSAETVTLSEPKFSRAAGVVTTHRGFVQCAITMPDLVTTS
jgi:hypothetical protein